MLTSGKNKKPLQILLGIVSIALFISGFSTSSIALAQSNTTTPTTVNVSDTPKMTNAQRLGINLGTQNFWDSGMMMRNLAFRNPGFEAETYQSILHCKVVTATSCTDDNAYNYWPSNFLKGGTATFIVGPAAGTSATITSNTPATIGVVGLTMQFSGLSVAPSVGDFVVVHINVPGNPLAGWWTQANGGATFSADTTDLSPNTPGKQALAINASGSGQYAILNNFDDGIPGKQFLKLNGTYTVFFRAKSTGGSNQLLLNLSRIASPGETFWTNTVALGNTWKDYSYTFQVTNDTTRPGSISLGFQIIGGSLLIDDVAFTEAASADNPTAYRNAVFETIKSLKPGTLRYMDGGLNWGSSFDNLLAPDFARTRSGYNTAKSEQDDIAMGLHDFLVLCQATGADPWFTMPTGMTTQEMSNMMDYFGGSTSTVYGAKRAALGQSAPWTSVFGQIHLEFGNEVWNTGNPGANIADAASYGKRATVIFGVAKASPSYNAKSFDFIVNGFEAVAYWTQLVLQNCSNYDTVGTATYNYGNYNDASSTEATFGPMMAEPEYMNSNVNGLTNLQAVAATTAGATPAKLAVYETNIGTQVGSTTQAQVQAAIPSVAAGVAVGANMLMAQRDLGVTVQNMFALEGYDVPFIPTTSGLTGLAALTPIWGVTIDMGGATNLQRPMYLAEKLANMAILPTLLATSQTGLNPTWNQPYSTNDNFSLPGAHYIQSVAYTDGTTLNIVLFNMSRTSALPVNFAGLNTPIGTATKTVLTAASITASNENGEQVALASSSQSLAAGTVLSLPPFSMTVLSLPAPVIPIQVYAVTDTCANTSLSASGTTTCTANVTGQGKYNSSVRWSAVSGTVSSSGNYVAPATYPASGKDTITATSIGDSTKSASFTIAVAPNTITSVTAKCPATSLGQGKSLKCTAVVAGTGGFSTGYAWSSSAGTITSTGNFTAPTTGTSVTLTATSTQDATKSSSVTLVLTPVLTLGPISSTVTSTTATVKWTVSMPANSAIAYGPTAAMALSTNYNPSTTQTPAITLTGLKPSTTYYLQPYSFNANQVATGSYTVTTPSSTTAVTGVAVSCSSTSLLTGGSTACSATVSGTGSYSSAVTWTTSLGSISSNGALTAPATLLGSTITVTATSASDPTKSGTSVISLSQTPTVTAVSLSCLATTITQGGTTTCTPTVTGAGSISKSVTFSTSAGTITTAGVLTAPTTGTSVTVTATSVQDSTKSASVVLTLTPPKLTMSAVTSVVTSTTASLSWTVNLPSNNGASYNAAGSAGVTTPYVATQTTNPIINLTGLLPSTTYTVSAFSFSGSQTVSTSLTFTTKAASSTVSSVAVTCPKTSLIVGNSTSCSAVVSGTGSYSSGVTWSSSAGAITSAGVFTAPATGTSVTVKATSIQDITKSAVATIALTPKTTVGGVTISCPVTSLNFGTNTTCSAAVTGTGSYSSAVTWSASAGTVTAGGLVTAPSAGTSLVLTATSTQDPTKSATSTLALSQKLQILNATFFATPTTYVVSWNVTESAHNGLDYDHGPNSKWSTTAYKYKTTTEPKFTISGLKPGTTYQVVLFSFTDAGETALQNMTITTPLK